MKEEFENKFLSPENALKVFEEFKNISSAVEQSLYEALYNIFQDKRNNDEADTFSLSAITTGIVNFINGFAEHVEGAQKTSFKTEFLESILHAFKYGRYYLNDRNYLPNERLSLINSFIIEIDIDTEKRLQKFIGNKINRRHLGNEAMYVLKNYLFRYFKDLEKKENV